MCKVLKIARSTYYFESSKADRIEADLLEKAVISAFKESKGVYGARKLRQEVRKLGITVSRRKVRQIMKSNSLVSIYTVKQFKVHSDGPNQDRIDNVVNQEFDGRSLHEVVVSDLTYVNVAGRWHYICILIDLFNREILGYSVGLHKNANLVHRAFMNTDIDLRSIQVFHTDRGSEFKNQIIDDVLNAFTINRSLSKPGCPYDNAVAETTYKAFKTEFIRNRRFECLEQLKMELFDYVHWYNNIRIHGSLGYLTPVQYRKNVSM